jgi:hypothetical protein
LEIEGAELLVELDLAVELFFALEPGFELGGFALFGLDGEHARDVVAERFAGPRRKREVGADELVVET